MKRFDLVVIRVNSRGLLRMSKPCIHCVIGLWKKCGDRLRNIYYSDEDGNIICVKFKDMLSCKTSCCVSKGNRHN